MTEAPKTARPDMTAADAAGLMSSYNVGERMDPNAVDLRNVMTEAVETVTPDTDLSEARDLMAQHRIRRMPVMRGDQLVGILSLGDVAVAAAS